MKLLPTLLVSGLVISTLSAYEMHEWGTFTTVSGSDGQLLTGLHVEEEHLPPFVYSHAEMRPQGFHFLYSLGNYSAHPSTPLQTSGQMLVRVGSDKQLHQYFSKGMHRAQLSNVTVKMETPVIYFYSDTNEKVNVKVGFNGGTISQWYPQRKSGDTPNKLDISAHQISPSLDKVRGDSDLVLALQPIDFLKPYKGSIEWDVEVFARKNSDPAFTFKANQNPTWIYPRVPDASMLKVGDEYEDYLFYRGIGNIQLPATFSVDPSETLRITNNCDQAIPFAFAFENINGSFRYKSLGSIAPNSSSNVAETDWVIPQNQQPEVFQQMRQGLVQQGLTHDEADGMVRTWWKSYFVKPGLRVFWVLPQQPLDAILPLELSPAPEKSVRVIVGRADVLRPRFEQEMIATLGTKDFARFQQDRFYLPYKNRLEQLISDPVFTKLTTNDISHLQLHITASNGESSISESLQLQPDTEVDLLHLALSGKWEVLSESKLQIGDTVFELDAKTGTLHATANQPLLALEQNYTHYQIQLPKVLN